MDFILSLIALEVIGAFFLLVVIRRERYKYSATEFFSLSFLLGAAFASFQLFLYYMAGISFDFINVSMLPIVSLILILARYVSKPERGRDFLPIEPVRFKLSIFEKWLLAGIVLQFLWTIFLTLPIPVHSHDAVANYALKAKIFYTYNGIPEGFFRLSESTVAHTDYPLLLPLLMRWVYAFTGQNDLVVNMIMPMIYLAFMGLFYALAKKILNRTCALVAVFFLATVPQVVDYATIIHADLVLTAFIACSIAYFVRYIRTGNRRQLDLASIFLGFSLWIKNEAIVFAGAFFLVFCIFAAKKNHLLKKRKVVDLVIFVVIITIIAAPWFIVKISDSAGNSDMNIAQLTFERVWQNVKDIPILLDLFQQEVFGPKKWNIFWVLFFSILVWKRKTLWKGENFYITLFLLLSVAGYFVGYMVTTGNNLFFYVNTTISRFMLHFTGICSLLAVLLYRDEINKV